jgi:hypothetical protein
MRGWPGFGGPLAPTSCANNVFKLEITTKLVAAMAVVKIRTRSKITVTTGTMKSKE